MEIAAGKFKAKCLGIMDEVAQTHDSVTITKRGKPVAKLVPVEDTPPKPLFGFLQGHVKIQGDIVASLEEEWQADV